MKVGVRFEEGDDEARPPRTKKELQIVDPETEEVSEVERWKRRRGLYTPRTMGELGRAAAFLRRLERGIEVRYRVQNRLVPVVVCADGATAWLSEKRLLSQRVRWRWTELTNVDTEPEALVFNEGDRRYTFCFLRLTLKDDVLEVATTSEKSRDILFEGFGLLQQHATQLFGDHTCDQECKAHSFQGLPLLRRASSSLMSSRPQLRRRSSRDLSATVRQFADQMDPRKRRSICRTVKFEQDIRQLNGRQTIVEVDASAFTNHHAEIWLPDKTQLKMPHPDILPGMYVLGAIASFDETRNEYTLDYVAGPFAIEVGISGGSQKRKKKKKVPTRNVVEVASMPKGTTFKRVHRSDMMLDMADQPTTRVFFAIAIPLVIAFIFYGYTERKIGGPRSMALQLVGDWDDACRDLRSQIYRLLSYQFIHADWRHCLFNAVATFILAFPTELIHGTLSVVALYEVAVVVAGVTAMTVDPFAIVVGASGGVYGLLGVHCGAVFLNWNELRVGPFNRYVRVVALSAIIIIDAVVQTNAATAAVSTAAHFGGFYAGFLFSLSLLQDLVVTEKRLRYTFLAIGILSTLLAIAWLAFHDPPSPFFGRTLGLPGARKHRSCCWQALDCNLDSRDRDDLSCSVSAYNEPRPTFILALIAETTVPSGDTPSCATLRSALRDLRQANSSSSSSSS